MSKKPASPAKKNANVAAKAPKTPKVVKTPRAQLETKNDVTRPAGGNTGRIWEISDAISQKSGSPALRADVIAKATAEGIPLATAATQYGRWRKFNGLTGRLAKAKSEKPAKSAKPVKGAKKPAPPAKKPAAPKPPKAAPAPASAPEAGTAAPATSDV